jgi:hypothetical protein
MEKPAKRDQDLQGEGNKTADQHYRSSATKHAQSGKSPPAADRAKRALEGDDGVELEEAERIGKSGKPHGAGK